MSKNSVGVATPSPVYKLMEHILSHRNNLQKLWLGRVLTIVDASIQDPEQRKAVKDLVKNAFYESEGWSGTTQRALVDFADKYLPDNSMDRWEAEHWQRIREEHPQETSF